MRAVGSLAVVHACGSAVVMRADVRLESASRNALLCLPRLASTRIRPVLFSLTAVRRHSWRRLTRTFPPVLSFDPFVSRSTLHRILHLEVRILSFLPNLHQDSFPSIFCSLPRRESNLDTQLGLIAPPPLPFSPSASSAFPQGLRSTPCHGGLGLPPSPPPDGLAALGWFWWQPRAFRASLRGLLAPRQLWTGLVLHRMQVFRTVVR